MLMPRGDGPFRVLESVNDNAYKLELPGDMGMSPTFNVGDLTPYLEDDDDDDDGDGDDLRAHHNQEGEDEENAMPISVQESTQVLLCTQKLHHKVSPCTDLELQFKVCSNPLRSITLLFWEGQESS